MKMAKPFGASEPSLLWTLHLPAWTIGLVVVGYPLSGLLSQRLGFEDDAMTVGFRALTAVLALACIASTPTRLWRLPSLLIVSFFSLYFARLGVDAAHGVDVSRPFLFIAAAILPVVLFLGTARKRVEWDKVVHALFLISLLTTLWSLSTYVYGEGGTTLVVRGRLQFEKISPITVGHTGAAAVICGICLFSTAESRLLKALCALSVSAGMFLMYLAASRGPVVSLFAVLLFMTCLRLSRLWIWALAAAVVGPLIALSFLNVDAVLSNLRLNQVGSDQSSYGRYEVLELGYSYFAESPLFGKAFAFPWGGYPHNLLVETGMAMGLVGLLLLTAMLSAAIRIAVRRCRTRLDLLSLLFVETLVGSMFSGSLWGNAPFWILSASLLAAGSAPYSFVSRSSRHLLRQDPEYLPT